MLKNIFSKYITQIYFYIRFFFLKINIFNLILLKLLVKNNKLLFSTNFK